MQSDEHGADHAEIGNVKEQREFDKVAVVEPQGGREEEEDRHAAQADLHEGQPSEMAVHRGRPGGED